LEETVWKVVPSGRILFGEIWMKLMWGIGEIYFGWK
jgi:hypothetical protein